MTTGVAVLGSTGSIGSSALRVLERQRDRFRVVALTAGKNAAGLAEQVAQWKPAYSALVDREGADCLVAAATRPDVRIVINGVVGAAGLQATLAALRAGKRVALANKETLVMAGELVTEAARAGGGEIIPVDSEHSAVLQCVTGRRPVDVKRLILTASGGPFREWAPDRIPAATVDEALRHPTWSMGRKITVDSATLVNKALEVIEAHFLFGLSYDAVEVVIHPQSIVHAFVEFVDGSVLAQLGFPTMELPILYALTHPDRVEDAGAPRFDPVKAGPLTFEPLSAARFPAFELGVAAGRDGGTAPAVFNAANEVAVQAFLDGKIAFGRIADVIEQALAGRGRNGGGRAGTLEGVLEADGKARDLARHAVRS